MHDFCIAIAKSTALHCLAECQVSALPINPVQILRYYGLSCKLVSDTSLHGSPGDIRREDYGRSAILVNADSTKEHQRFIILHEIGHYLMGHVFPDTSKRIREESEQEVQNMYYVLDDQNERTGESFKVIKEEETEEEMEVQE